ncbi:hypothetical protein ABFS82_10G166000 [Erythranthe guttata]|uniref:uncharacterized protein LOC105949328 isoform X1 n=1 Tax=Erythranthe guttata TaxID=4155 RepID=UPI00064D7DAE|nr:PREDICTED: uncharacterized protein LOC105949328 isoform X1 [Erythranthe guttata]|eukprot:XP_012828071.1 PREDICTED: uncharacterized protein LOC105949328 isoform X1 [Erythranthe guttata]
MEEGEEHHLIGHTSGSESGPMVSATVGRAMTTLLSAKPKKLQDAISNLHSPPKIAALTVSMEQSLWFLHKYIGEAAETGEHLDQVLVPILQHTLTTRESKRGNSVLILLNWLFQDEVLFQVTVTNLAAVISRRDDRYVALGWCILGRSLIEYENVAKNVATNAIREKYAVILKIFCSCVTHLLSIICKGSNMHEGFELPTRLAVAAADFILSLTVALTRKDLPSNNITKRQTSSFVTAKSQPLNSLVTATNDRDEDTLRKASELPPSLELKFLLWNNLEELITLVKKLTAWSRKSRSLQAKGLERVLKWLKELKQHNSSFQDEAELQMLKTGSLLLSSCWKHYGMLLRLEDHKISQQHKELLEQYLSGIQFYADDQAEEHDASKSSKSETINFFLNCLLLLLGRLDNEQFANAVTEFGSQVSQVLISQLRCPDEEVINGAMSIFKAVVLGTNHTLSKRSMGDVRQMDALLPLLLNLLDERDAAAKAIVKLLAEYCSICSDSECLNEVLKRIGSKNVAQRRNAIDVLSDLIHVSTGSTNTLPQASWQDVANHLLECLGDEDQIIRDQAAKLIPMIDPPLVLSTLVDLSYSTQESVQISASTALVALLVNHKHNPEILCLLLDCLSKLSQNPDSGAVIGTKEGSTLDADRLLKLLSEWAKHVEDWHVVVGPLIDKMLAEPSNALIVRFLSHISEYLAEAVDIVFNRLVSYMKQQKVIDECNSKWKGRTDSKSEAMKHEHCLFNRLCPLLIIRLLPLRVFDDLNSPLVYGDLPSNSPLRENRQINIEVSDCIAALMISRALSKSEFEDVRKLAAELCGRIHPEILVPILSSELEAAANAKDVFKIKVCLFSFCTSLMVRGNSTYKHPNAFRIRKTIHQILSWSSVDSDEISKAQHGCIDCLALMLCTEIQSPKSSKGTAIARDSVLAYVMNQLTGDKKDSSFESEGSDRVTDATARLSFRLCMANVLISACQKISDTGKKSFVKKIVPCVIRSIGEVVEPDIRAACVQILFSVAYHLKSSIFSHSNDLLSVALKSLRDGSQKERMAGAKLVMCLMASEEDVVESISAGLLEARALLQKLSSTEPSPDVRQICRQLVVYLTSR